MVVIGVLPLICLWWMGRYFQSMDTAGVSFDVVGVPTLATGVLVTLGSGLFAMMAVRFCNCCVYCSFCAAVGGTMSPKFPHYLCCCNIVSSSWLRLVILQCITKSLVELATRMALVYGI